MTKNEHLEITIKYKSFKQVISGSPKSVTKEYFIFLNNVLPAFEIISGLTFEPDLTDMALKIKGSVQFYKNRVFILKRNLLVEDSILLALVAKYIGFGLQLTSNDCMSLQEILDTTGKSKKSVVKVLKRLNEKHAIDQLLEGKYRVFDWKAYDYLLRKLPDKKNIKLTDFINGPELFEKQFPIYTVGYQGLEPDQFLKIVKEEGIEVLVDVRRDAYSKQNRNYSEGTLSKLLNKVGINYVHLPLSGIDYDLREELRSTRDYEVYFKRYSDYLEKNQDLLTFISELAKNYVICLMCYEKDFRRCHRSILAKKLEEQGFTLLHK